MSVDFYSFEMLTGRRLTPLPVSSGDWKLTTNADETISCVVPARAAVTAKLQIWSQTTLARTGLLVVVDDVPVAAGPLWKRSYAQGSDLSFTAGGLRSYWDKRLLLPASARAASIIGPDGDPDPAFDFAVSGVSMGTIAKRYIELAQLWPGAAIPLVLPADVAGTSSDTVKAIDLKKIRTLLDNLTQRENGVDIAFRPRWAADGLGIYWELQTGTDAQPRLGNPDPAFVQWTVGATKGGAFDLEVSEDGTGLADEVFVLGGKASDQVIVAHSRNLALPNNNYPLLQRADTGHTDIVEQTTAQTYADQSAYLGQFASSFWSMSVRAHEQGTPELGDYWLGDMATITVAAAEPILPAGNHYRRIASIAGDAEGQDYRIVFGEAVA